MRDTPSRERASWLQPRKATRVSTMSERLDCPPWCEDHKLDTPAGDIVVHRRVLLDGARVDVELEETWTRDPVTAPLAFADRGIWLNVRNDSSGVLLDDVEAAEVAEAMTRAVKLLTAR